MIRCKNEYKSILLFSFFIFKEMKYGIINVPLSPVRKIPDHPYEMTNQMVYGEPIKILGEAKNNWVAVKSLYDGYGGWITKGHFIYSKEIVDFQQDVYITTAPFTQVLAQNTSVYLPFGSFIYSVKQQGQLVSLQDFPFLHLKLFSDKGEKANLKRSAEKWLNAPYLWGGKSIFGIDCSGFVQNIFKEIGIILPRDAFQQAERGIIINSVKEAQLGDLAFFKAKQKITHVGMMLDSHTIIHAAGKVRIDTLDELGILNAENQERTHHLAFIKRVLQ